MNTMMKCEEFVLETAVTFDKVKVLIYMLVVAEEWKKQVYPLVKGHLVNLNSYRHYLPLYHEAAVANLL